MGIEFELPPRHPFNPLRALRLAITMGEVHSVQAIFKAIWVDGHIPDNDVGWAGIQAAVGINDGDARVSQSEVKASLISNGEEAIAAGVFGVPTIVIDDKIFWGDDAFEMFLDYLREPNMMETKAMKQAANLVPSSERKR